MMHPVGHVSCLMMLRAAVFVVWMQQCLWPGSSSVCGLRMLKAIRSATLRMQCHGQTTMLLSLLFIA
jgi:hypothetical protein